MECEIARQKLLNRLDCEIDVEADALSPAADAELEKHLAGCAGCRRQYRLLSLPRASAAATPSVTAPPWFYQQICLRIEDKA